MIAARRGFSPRFDEALVYASDVHRAQTRKSAPVIDAREAVVPVPYIGHLLSVAGIVIDAHGSEEEAIAALLHDAAEDQGGEPRLADIARRFGERVGEIVRGCSDALTLDPQQKPPWRTRKERYIEHITRCADRSVYLVSSADKLHNARATALDLSLAHDAKDVWAKFDPAAGREGTLWYYRSLVAAYRNGPEDPRREPIVMQLTRAVDSMDAVSRT